MITEDYLIEYNIDHHYNDGKLIINNNNNGKTLFPNILEDNSAFLDKDLFSNCIIYGELYLDKLKEVHPDFLFGTTIISQDTNLVNLSFESLKEIPEGFLRNTICQNLYFDNLEYLPKNFNVNVKSEIWMQRLKSKTLRDLLENPGPRRQLAFNLLKNII